MWLSRLDECPEIRFKQVIVVRLDLGMGRGKIAVQCCHASVSAAEEARVSRRDWWRDWLLEGQCKIVLKVKIADELLGLEKESVARALPHSLVQDKGLTQVAPGTITCLGIGPAPADVINALTRHLPLL